MRASSRRSETSPAEARTTTERALTGCATEREGHVSREVVEETGISRRRLGARRRSRPAMELEKKAAEAHLRGDGGARDAGPGGGNTRDGGDNAEGGHGGGHFDVKCGGLRDPCGTLWVAQGLGFTSD